MKNKITAGIALAILFLASLAADAANYSRFEEVLVKNYVGIGTSSPISSSKAALQIDSTTKGVLVPRMTTVQRDAITSPITGLWLFDTTAGRPAYYNGSAWLQIASTSGVETFTNKTLSGNTATNLISGSGTLTLNTSGTATVPNATDTLVGKATTDTLTNKTIDADGTGNSITNIENADIKAAAAIAVNKLAALTASRAMVTDGSGFNSVATTTATEIGYVNGVTSSLCGISQACTLTNKTFDADSNTVSNIENADIKAAAAIAVNKLAAVTASRALVSDGSGFISPATTTSTEIGYVNGVTSAIQTQLDAKAPSASPTFTGTVKIGTLSNVGDIAVAIGSTTIGAIPAATSGYVLTANGAGTVPTFQANSAGLSAASEIVNCSIATSVGSSALTIALKDGAGSDATAGSPCKIGFRNATTATGTFTEVSTTAALSVVVSNGSSLGCTASVACVLYVYAINSGSGVVLGVIGWGILDEGSVLTSTAEGGAGAADSASVLYSTAGQTSKPIRLLARIVITPGASFAWSANSTEISNTPFHKGEVYSNGTGQRRIEYAQISGGTSIGYQSGRWIASLANNATGDYTVTLNTGMFSGNISCVCTVINASTPNSRICKIYSQSNSSVRVFTASYLDVAGAENSNLFCFGER